MQTSRFREFRRLGLDPASACNRCEMLGTEPDDPVLLGHFREFERNLMPGQAGSRLSLRSWLRTTSNTNSEIVWLVTGCRGVGRLGLRVGRLGGLFPGLRLTAERGEV